MASDLEQKARELLDTALRDLGLHEDAYHVGCGAELDQNDRAAINAIVAALRAAPEQRAAEGFAAADMADAAAGGFERGQAVPEDVRRDAGRYRWLRKHLVNWCPDDDTARLSWHAREVLDAEIDAAMKEQER